MKFDSFHQASLICCRWNSAPQSKRSHGSLGNKSLSFLLTKANNSLTFTENKRVSKILNNLVWCSALKYQKSLDNLFPLEWWTQAPESVCIVLSILSHWNKLNFMQWIYDNILTLLMLDFYRQMQWAYELSESTMNVLLKRLLIRNPEFLCLWIWFKNKVCP